MALSLSSIRKVLVAQLDVPICGVVSFELDAIASMKKGLLVASSLVSENGSSWLSPRNRVGELKRLIWLRKIKRADVKLLKYVRHRVSHVAGL
jgi:hypothetical protein